MNKITQSRHSELDMEKIRSKCSIFETIIKASERVYRLRKGALPKPPHSKDLNPFNTGVITALLEVQNKL